MAAAGHLLDELRQLAYLSLPNVACTQRIVQRHDEQLNRAATALDDGVERITGTGSVLTAQSTALVRCDRPARDQAHSRQPILLLPVTHEQAVVESEPLGDQLRLVGIRV